MSARQGASASGIPAQSATRGIALMLLGTFLFTVMDALAKWASARYPIIELVFCRSVFAMVPLGFALRRQGLASLRTRRPLGHLLRTLVGMAALATFFLSFKLMPLADAYAIAFAAPLFVTALSVPLLGEPVGMRRWSAVLVGFAGVLIMVKPSTGVFHPVALLPLLGAVLYAFVVIILRVLARTESSATIVFYFSLIAGILTGACMPWFWVTPDWKGLAVLAGLGIVGGFGQLVMTGAFKAAEVSVVIPFEYSAMLWAAGIGYLVWGDVPGVNIWVGVALVSASGIYIALREARLTGPGAADS